jgi:hypothetical protein
MKRIIETSSLKATTLSVCFFVAVTSAVLCGCAKPGQQQAETASSPQAAQPPQATQPPPTAIKQPEPVKAIETAPPRLQEVQSAIARVYEGTMTVDANRFLAGDLDGDGSQDLIAVVKPVRAMLPEINSELARWRIEDPRKIFVPKITNRLQTMPKAPDPVFANEGDVLMVVIHGHGPNGWRAPEAMNTYLLKNAVGNGISMQKMKEAMSFARGKKRPLNLRGDVIKQTLGGEPGFLFWTGADYAWHSLQNNKTPERQSSQRLSTRS